MDQLASTLPAITSNCETSARSFARLPCRVRRRFRFFKQLTETPLAEIKYYHFQ